MKCTVSTFFIFSRCSFDIFKIFATWGYSAIVGNTFDYCNLGYASRIQWNRDTSQYCTPHRTARTMDSHLDQNFTWTELLWRVPQWSVCISTLFIIPIFNGKQKYSQCRKDFPKIKKTGYHFKKINLVANFFLIGSALILCVILWRSLYKLFLEYQEEN